MYSFVIILNSAVISFFESKNTNRSCHCEEYNDEAIRRHTSLFEDWIASPSLARNDEKKRDYLLSKKLITKNNRLTYGVLL